MLPITPFQAAPEAFTPNVQSITKIIPAMSNEATKTKTEDSCKDPHEGHVTLWINSS
jgi:hypothetical protein